MKSTALPGNLLNSCFARLKRMMQLASVSFCAWRFLTHFKCNSSWIIRTTDERWMPISLTICRVWGASSWMRTRSLTALIFTIVQTVLGLLLPDFHIVEPVSFKRLRKSFTVVFFQPLAGKFTYQSLGTIAFKIIQIFNQNTILFTQHHLYCLH